MPLRRLFFPQGTTDWQVLLLSLTLLPACAPLHLPLLGRYAHTRLILQICWPLWPLIALATHHRHRLSPWSLRLYSLALIYHLFYFRLFETFYEDRSIRLLQHVSLLLPLLFYYNFLLANTQHKVNNNIILLAAAMVRTFLAPHAALARMPRFRGLAACQHMPPRLLSPGVLRAAMASSASNRFATVMIRAPYSVGLRTMRDLQAADYTCQFQLGFSLCLLACSDAQACPDCYAIASQFSYSLLTYMLAFIGRGAIRQKCITGT